MLGETPEIGLLEPKSRTKRIEAKKQRLSRCFEMREITPFDLISFHPWPDSEESNVTIL